MRDAWLRPYGGDVLATIFVYCLLRGLTGGTMGRSLLLALLISYGIELGQYLRLVEHLGPGNYRLVRIVLGSTFTWSDMLAYTIGAGIVLIVEALLGSNYRQRQERHNIYF
ncbi:DUF2809 domain-containing protein [Hymenobacter sp. ASUV-10]|uniref:DUF2809 domain-containing protein n=1 Tax=Hymenobacter aranciens TaxID=3063996 RepID=A0ABT9BB31_9BACT|nr:DUF2809 domain-containing protein [Hymenobacter sp. ASUV-10]